MPTVIAERYRVEAVLGRGGMAVVYQVYDPVRDRRLALKRLLPEHAANASVARLFELEYHTLSQLVHPRIIEVYDYQTDAEGPSYTMELLTGGDLRQRSPIAWPEACRLLSDICSALALLHSRRLVHRDLTPLNVRCTADGRAKLFDFGSMTQIGRTKYVVGTPPFVAPEALSGEVIDGQTDLYALGATAYYALTGRHAYPARTLAELPDLWLSTPLAPKAIVPSIPAELDDLVMALLQKSPAGRPASAAEVMERLSAIGGFEVTEELVVRQAYLSMPTLVGRDEQLAAFQRRLLRLKTGQGTALLVHSARGGGRSRLLDVCALEAKLAGTLVLRADSTAGSGRRWGVASKLLEQLLQQAPELGAKLLTDHKALLVPLMPALMQRLDPDAAAATARTSVLPSAEVDQPARAELQTALREIMLAVAQQHALVLVVDDLDNLDEPSAALIALLAHQAAQQRILIVVAAETDVIKRNEQPALQLIWSLADAVRLRDLNLPQTTGLMISLFGAVANVRWLADRIFSVTRGNPAKIMRVAQQLVERGECNYAGGTWTLPASLDPELLTSALAEQLDPTLPPSALELAQALVLSELAPLSLAECLRLTAHGDFKQLHTDLQALGAAGIVTVDQDEAALARAGLESLLLSKLAPGLRRVLHKRIADSLEQRPALRFRRAQQLLHAGDVDGSLALAVSEIYEHSEARKRDPESTFEHLQGLPKTWAQTYHTLIEACRTLQRPLRDRLALQLDLLSYTTLSARFEGAVVLEVAEQLRHDTGLDLVAALADHVPANELLSAALTAAQQRFEATPERERGMPLFEALSTLGQLVIQVIGIAGRALDLALLRDMPSLKPLVSLSPALAIVEKNYQSTLSNLGGNAEGAKRAYREIAQRIQEPDGAGLSESHRFHMHAAVVWAAGTTDAYLGRPAALEAAAAIEHNPLFVVSALRLRGQYAVVRGDRDGAERYRAQVELLQIQNCPPQLFEGWHAMHLTLAHAQLGDLLRVKQGLAELELMAREHAGWRPVLHCGRGAYQMLRGDYAHAQREFESALALMPTYQHHVASYCAGALVWSLTRQRDYQAAVERGTQLCDSLNAAAGHYATYRVLVPVALAESRLGQHTNALNHIQAAIDFFSAEGGGGLWLSEAYEVRAYIAIDMADADTFVTYAAACEREQRLSGYSGPVFQHEKLLRAARDAQLIDSGGPSVQLDLSAVRAADIDPSVVTVLGMAHNAAERAQRALNLLGQALHCQLGFLYLSGRNGLTIAAQLGTPTTWFGMDQLLADFAKAALDAENVTQTAVSDDAVELTRWKVSGSTSFTPILLSHPSEQGLIVAGVALLALDEAGLRSVPTRLLHALSKALVDAGDVVTVLDRPGAASARDA
jgi:tetratricopeptide (TPR) repeat protein